MLCNCGNVAIRNEGEGDNNIESLDSLNIELLNSAFQFQAPMESFIAPSVDNIHEKENLGSSILGMVDENTSIAHELFSMGIAYGFAKP